MDSFYTKNELIDLGLENIGENVLISRKASIYGAKNISIGSNVRIDDFCILSGKIKIGSYVHIAAYSALFGGDKGIELNDFSGVSARVTIYSASDDYSGESLTNPMIPDKYKNIYSEKVVLGKHVIVGAGSVILPGVNLGEGSSVGSMSLITKSTKPWSIYFGIPAKRMNERSKRLLELEKKFKSESK